MNDILKNCPSKKINKLDVPSIRACPKCYTRIEHKENCKHMKCYNCKTEYCHICLGIKANGVWPCGNYNDEC